jgi:trk system potassium uptake protein TrkH
MVLLLTDLDPLTAFSAVLASVHCMGPGLGALVHHPTTRC